MYEAHNGVVLSADDVVMHSCNNAGCANPLHLTKGTVAENNAYKKESGSRPTPKKERVKLTCADVIKIRLRLKYKHGVTKIARDMNAHVRTIADIKNNVTWKNCQLADQPKEEYNPHEDI